MSPSRSAVEIIENPHPVSLYVMRRRDMHIERLPTYLPGLFVVCCSDVEGAAGPDGHLSRPDPAVEGSRGGGAG